MKGPVAQESEIMADILALKEYPEEFVFYAYPWGRPNSPLEHFKGPRDWQLEELRRIGQHVRDNQFAIDNGLPAEVFRGAWSSGRGPGKSALLGMVAHWLMSTNPGAPVIVTANTEGQLRAKTFPEFAFWFGCAINSHWFSVETMRITPATWLLDTFRRPPEEGGRGIDPKYWYVAGQTWNADNPDAFAGAHNPYGMCVLFDEASGIPSPIWNVTEGFFTELNAFRFWLAMSQMRSRKERFFEIFNDEKLGQGWYRRTLSTRGMPGVDQTLVKRQIATYGEDSDFVRVEIDGKPPQTSEDQFISWSAVNQAQTNQLMPDYGEALILGVDPAPRGKTAWRFRAGRDARNICGGATHGAWYGLDNVRIAEEVLKLDARFKPKYVCIDFGMGTGVIDILKRKRLHGKLVEVKFGASPHEKDSEFGSHAAELWGRVRDWLPGGMIEQDDGSKGTLSHQLTDRGWKWSGREDNKKVLESKEDLKARGVESPDDADALACTFEFPNPPRIDRVREPAGAPEEEDSGWYGE